MNIRLIIHTENKNKLINLFKLINESPKFNEFSIYLHAKGYVPWEDVVLKQIITSFKEYSAYPTTKNKIESLIEIVSIINDELILILDEDALSIPITEWNINNYNSLFTKKNEFIKLNLDTKYQTLKWFLIDLMSQRNNVIFDIDDSSYDCERYKFKVLSPHFKGKIIYIDGGMGDHVMALPLLEKIQMDVYVCCKYPFLFDHLNVKGFINWNDELFGGYKRFVYEYGSRHNSKTIIDAFFGMYGYNRSENDILKYYGKREPILIDSDKKIALICTSAAKIENKDSNKDWGDIKWFKLVNELKNNGYFVIQVGTIKDNQIPNVDFKFLDKPISQLTTLIEMSELWLSVDTFFHHFAAAIKPDVGICLTPYYNDHAKHSGVTYIEKDCGKNFSQRRWWLDLQQPERKECMDLITIEDVMKALFNKGINIKKKSNLTWLAKFDDFSSMGILSQHLLGSLNNTDISCKSILGKTETNNKNIITWLNKDVNHDLGIMFAYPDSYGELNNFNTKVIYTGVDSTGGIPNFTFNSNQVDYLLTPSFKSKERMEKLGVTKPIFVLPHGIDPQVFQYKPRIKTDKFKFLYVGECSDRKGIFHLLDVFIELFGTNLDVELHIKSNTAMVFYNGQDIKKYTEVYKNIFWYVSNEGHEKVIDLYNDCHVYVYPSRADTFGMTLLEAMACGLPIISTSEPGATELIKDRYFDVRTTLTPVVNHPWMLGEWGEPNIHDLKYFMLSLFNDYEKHANPQLLKENSDFVINNYSWEKIGQKFEDEILPNLKKDIKIITLLTSFNRPNHIGNVINSMKSIKEDGYINDIYIVDNTDTEVKDDVINIINTNIDNHFTIYNSDFNLGQRGALLQMLEDNNIDEYDFIQFSDQDNLFLEPLSTYCSILNENHDIFFVTGYMSKEHAELGWRKTRFGNLCEKRSLRAGHMFLRVKDFKTLLPIHLDSQYNQPHNSSWNAGLDWELSYWNINAPGRKHTNNFVLCVPGGVLHVGVDSTMYNWDVNAHEYKLDELKSFRY
jgi:glycosyltransferase involved in cell wall biosynthesis